MGLAYPRFIESSMLNFPPFQADLAAEPPGNVAGDCGFRLLSALIGSRGNAKF
jgi:hypothetical protein